MGKYKHDMSGEKSPEGNFPVGRNECIVVNCEESVSKAGNVMFIITLGLASDLLTTITVYAIATPKKRWLLKQLLDACGVAAAQDGMYDWDIPDILNKRIIAVAKAEEEKWMDRDGCERKATKAKVHGFDRIMPKTGISGDPDDDHGVVEAEEDSVPF